MVPHMLKVSTVVMAKVSSVQLTDAAVVAAVMDAVEVAAMAVVMVVIECRSSVTKNMPVVPTPLVSFPK